MRRVSFSRGQSGGGSSLHTPVRRPSKLIVSSSAPPPATETTEKKGNLASPSFSPNSSKRCLEEFGEAKWLAEAKKQERVSFTEQGWLQEEISAVQPTAKVDRDGAIAQWHKVYSKYKWQEQQEGRIAKEKVDSHTDNNDVTMNALQHAKNLLSQLKLRVVQEKTWKLEAVAQVEALKCSKEHLLGSEQLAAGVSQLDQMVRRMLENDGRCFIQEQYHHPRADEAAAPTATPTATPLGAPSYNPNHFAVSGQGNTSPQRSAPPPQKFMLFNSTRRSPSISSWQEYNERHWPTSHQRHHHQYHLQQQQHHHHQQQQQPPPRTAQTYAATASSPPRPPATYVLTDENKVDPPVPVSKRLLSPWLPAE